MAQQAVQEEGQLQLTLKQTLEQCVSLARKKIRSKKGITQLQALLTDYRSNTELATIIFEVVKLVTAYETAKKEQSDEIKDTVPLEQYNSLELLLQKYEASVRQHIKNQQQLKIYCDDLEQKNRELEKNNEELLKNTKQIITTLKKENQRLIEENGKFRERAKENERKDREQLLPRDTQESIINSIKKARKMVDSQAGSHHDGHATPIAPSQRSEQSMKAKRHSLSSIKQNK